MNFKKDHIKQIIFPSLIFLIFLLFVYRSLISNITSHLPDWLDYALVNWLIFQNVEKIISLNFTNFFDTNAFYPHKYTYFFTDTFLPQAIMTIPAYLLSKNYILSFNITFLITLTLNYLSTYLFWKQIFKNYLIGIFGSLLIFFSPFFHLEKSHFQMLSYWPFFFCLYFIFKFWDSHNIRYLLLGAAFFAIQFLASIYLFVFLLFTLIVFFIINLFQRHKKKLVIKSSIIILILFILIDGIFIKGYFDMKNNYQFKRDFKEYIVYSANLSDYLFTSRINSLVHQSPALQKWNNADKNSIFGKAQFPGFLIFLLGIAGLLKIIRKNGTISFVLPISLEKAFFLSLLLMGSLFSLGPRIVFNGTYSHLPAPYAPFLKLLPFLESIRATARWSFLFYLGLIYFSLLSLKWALKKYNPSLIYFAFILLFIAEYVPLNISTHQEQIIDGKYTLLKDRCSLKKQVILEIPVTHLDVYPGIGEGVNYISKVELASLYHKCYLVNGYSGYDLPELFTLRDKLYQTIINKDTADFLKEARNSHADIIKFNQEKLPREIEILLPTFLRQLSQEPGVKQLDDQLFQIR